MATYNGTLNALATAAIPGVNSNGSSSNPAIVGYAASGSNLAAIYGWGSAGNGVLGYSPMVAGGAVAGVNTATGQNGYGVYGYANNAGLYGESPHIGVYGIANTSQGWAGYFVGDVGVTRVLNAASKAFKIDHPLDPTNKVLMHSCVESSEMKNLYTGVVTADAFGEAVVQMPAWFDALNEDCHYQLTPLGKAAPDLHVSQEMRSGVFAIAGASPAQKISWTVTGNRKDAFAKANPLVVEEDKPADERGFFLHPEAHGAPKERGIETERQRRLKEAEAAQLAAAEAAAP